MRNNLHIVAVTATIYNDGKFLILKRADGENAFPGKWQTPGGKVEINEDILTALFREVKEEAGIEIKGTQYLDNYHFTRPDGIHVIGIDFLCEYKTGNVKLSPDHTDYAWISPKEAENYDLIEDIKGRIRKAAELIDIKG